LLAAEKTRADAVRIAWGRFRRRSDAGTFGIALVGLHANAWLDLGRSARLPSLVLIDSQLARRPCTGGPTCHDRSEHWGTAAGVPWVIARDVMDVTVPAWRFGLAGRGRAAQGFVRSIEQCVFT
jgi:hypothetical protein